MVPPGGAGLHISVIPVKKNLPQECPEARSQMIPDLGLTDGIKYHLHVEVLKTKLKVLGL